MTDFMECDACRAKPGSPLLCAACLHNRNLFHCMRQSIIAVEGYKARSVARLDEAAVIVNQALDDARAEVAHERDSLLVEEAKRCEERDAARSERDEAQTMIRMARTKLDEAETLFERGQRHSSVQDERDYDAAMQKFREAIKALGA